MILPLIDCFALFWFLLMWIGYDRFADSWSNSHASLLRHVNEARRDWMLRLTYRENRIADVALMANLSSSPTFFASTTIIISWLVGVICHSDRHRNSFCFLK